MELRPHQPPAPRDTAASTRSLQDAIDAAGRDGGGRVVVPAGEHMSGPLRLRSHVELHLAAGAVLRFSDRRTDYPLVLTDWEGEEAVRCASPLMADDCTDIAITGTGTIDGSGQVWRPVKRYKVTDEQWNSFLATGGVVVPRGDGQIWYPTDAALRGESEVRALRASAAPIEAYEPFRDFLRPNLLKFTRCRNVTLDGPTFINSAAWCLHLLLCDNVTVRRVSVINPPYAQNGDAIDIESCRNVSVTGSIFDAGDDAICIKSGRDESGRRRGVPSENIDIRNCTVLHGHGGVVVGSEMSGGVRNVSVADCVFRGTDVGLRFKTTRGRGGVVENVDVVNVAMHAIRNDAISLNMFYTNRDAPPEPAGERTPTFRGIRFRNITCDGAKRAIELRGLPERPISDIAFDNVRIAAAQGATVTDAERIRFGDVTLRIDGGPGLTCERVRQLDCRGLDVCRGPGG